MIHIVITGSRDWPIDKAPIIWNAMEKVWIRIQSPLERWENPEVMFHHGMCPYGGADLIGASWASGAGWLVRPHPPKQQVGWAYAQRNKEMIDLLPDYVVVCYLEGAKNAGTKMTHDMAIAAGIPEDRIIEVRG